MIHGTLVSGYLYWISRYALLVVGIGIVWTFEIFSGIYADDETETKW